MNKQHALDAIAEEIAHCEQCKVDTVGTAVPGAGNPDAKIVFIGEAPGKTEAQTGEPFVGRSGKLLRSYIQSIGLDDQKEVYITSPVKYLPSSGMPKPMQIAHGRLHLKKQLDIIDPEIIVLMGSVAAQGVLEQKIPVKREHGKTIEKDGKTYFLTVHPAAGLRFPPLRQVFEADFQKLKTLLK